jgi:serine/threonine protein kinase
MSAPPPTFVSPRSERPPATDPSGTPISSLRHARRALPSQLTPICDFGRYQLLGRIAVGGMAEIFLAREPSAAGGSRTIVIKRILNHVANDQRFVQMFLDEARLALQLRHPSICHIYEFGEVNHSFFIAMEWIDGVPLGRLIKRVRDARGHALAPTIAARVIAQTAEALEYAHRAVDESGRSMAIVHRDVSPQNIMVSYQGSVKLLDFGIAKAETHATKTTAGQVKGKFAYMSPQQCVGDPVDGRADVFALGVCLYEALAARNLYRRKTEYETMRAIIEGPVPSVLSIDPNLPPELDDIVTRALAKDPDDRFQSAAAMQNALEHWLARSGEIVNATTIATYVSTLFEVERRSGPLVEVSPIESVPAPRPRAREGSSNAAFVWVAIVLSIFLIGGAVAVALFLYFDSRSRTAEVEAPVARDEPVAAPVREETQPPWETGDVEFPAGAQYGALLLTSTPAGATVQVDERVLDERTPITLNELAPGTYRLRVERSGFEPYEAETVIAAGEVARVEVTLAASEAVQPVARTGRLSVNTRPWSRVFVGGRSLGTTPIGGATVPAGTIRLRLVDRDGTTHERSVRVRPNEETRIFFDLVE